MYRELDEQSLRDYYYSLGRKEKGKMLRYLCGECGMGYSTIISKLAGRLEFTKKDVVLLNLSIQNKQKWK